VASHVLDNSEAVVKLKFRLLGWHVMKPGDWKPLCLQNSALCSRCRAARCMYVRSAQRITYSQSALVTKMLTLLIVCFMWSVQGRARDIYIYIYI
jgi:hypothetical protein